MIWPPQKKLTTFFLASFIFLVPSAWSQETLEPLDDPNENNMTHQLTRCSAFYTAFRGLLLERLLNVTDPLERSSMQDSITRSANHADGLLKTAAVASVEIDGLSKEQAVNRVVNERDAYSIKYIRQFVLDGATVSQPFRSELWKKDTAACVAFVNTLGTKN